MSTSVTEEVVLVEHQGDGVSRITFRELALNGKIPGVTKSSW